MPGSPARSPARSPIRRIFANTAWLLGGKVFGGICGLAYLAILTNGLGLKGFGHFVLIFGMAQALIAIAGFETWRVVVRFGSKHVLAGDWPKFGRLSLLCGTIDAAGAVCGCGFAAVIIYGFGPMLDLNESYVDAAFWFNCAMLWALVSAPTGIVRALQRFDVAVYVEAIVPLFRLLAAVVIWLVGPTVERFLLAWAAIDLIESGIYWFMARNLCPQAIKREHFGNWQQTLDENPGIARFFWITYASTSLRAITQHGPLFAVGALVGTSSAGLFRLASQLSHAMSKLSSLLMRAAYAEFAQTRIAASAGDFRKLAVQTSLAAAGAGAVVVLAAMLVGKHLFSLFGGSELEYGAVILVPLAIAGSFELASVAFEPVLHSSGRAGQALLAWLLSVSVLVAGIALLYSYDAIGIAWAVAAASAVVYVALGIAAYRTLTMRPTPGSLAPEPGSPGSPPGA